MLYASARDGYALSALDDIPENIVPVLDAILQKIPPPAGDSQESLQILVAALDYDDYAGQIAIGKVSRGTVSSKMPVTLMSTGGGNSRHTLESVFIFEGMGKKKVAGASVGDIVAMTGLENVRIGDTISDQYSPEALEPIKVCLLYTSDAADEG